MLLSLLDISVNAEGVRQTLDRKNSKHEGQQDLEWAR